MENVISLIDVFVLAYGALLIFSALSSRVTGTINKLVLWDRKTPFVKCRNKRGFINYVSPRMFIVGLEVFTFGIFGIVSSRYVDLYNRFYNIGLIITVGCLAYYIYFMSKANKKFY